MQYSDTQHQADKTALSGFTMHYLHSLRMRAPGHVIPVAAMRDMPLLLNAPPMFMAYGINNGQFCFLKVTFSSILTHLV